VINAATIRQPVPPSELFSLLTSADTAPKPAQAGGKNHLSNKKFG